MYNKIERKIIRYYIFNKSICLFAVYPINVLMNIKFF